MGVATLPALGASMSLVALIDDTSKAIANDPANGQVEFTALGTLVGVTDGSAHVQGGRAAGAGRGRRRGQPGAVRPGLARLLPGHHLPVLGRAPRGGAGLLVRAGRGR